MLGKLFGGKKKSEGGFYLELDDNEAPAEKTSQVATPTESPAVEKATEPQAVTSTKNPAGEKVAETDDQTIKKPKQKRQKSKKSTEKTAQVQQSQPPTTAGAASSWEPPFWVAALYKKKNDSNGMGKSEQTFASQSMLPLSMPRRRPGPSMNKFKDLASQIKLPKS
ncbi:MAG: hypothetical protein D6756_10975 [Cyanobacteria bacterium J083]|nr:MAG: hypothetical protein D6756_10975 [Cyanobacteria bacterium J083]